MEGVRAKREVGDWWDRTQRWYVCWEKHLEAAGSDLIAESYHFWTQGEF
jgi:hypothetical protein